MKTILYTIKDNSDKNFIEQKLNDHAYCRRLVYKKLEESSDIDFLNYCKDRFKLTDIEIRSIVQKATQLRNTFLSKIKKTEEEIEDIITDIEDLKVSINELKNKNVTDTRTKKIGLLKKTIFILNRKLDKKNKFIKSDIVFGSKKLLSDISFLSNNKSLNFNIIEEKKKDYLKKRKGDIYLMGEANQKGNRFFDFDLVNKIITYKPFHGKKIELKICNRIDKFEKELQSAIDNKQLSVSVSLNNDIISLSFDEATLCGFSINKSERKLEVKEATKYVVSKEEHAAIAKEIYASYYNRLRERQLSDKLSNRYLGIDLNPEYIGYSIIDKLPNGEISIIMAGSFNFTAITKKTSLSSDHPETVKRNNKRKHERSESICELFSLMKHYHVGTFIMEDLNFKSTNKIERKEFNRKIKNIWDRDLISALINKKCTEGGFILDLVNPVYTSLIGNLSYRVFDPVASSLEIVRRGCTKYDKGCFYPLETALTFHTMEAVAKRNGIDVELIRDASWVKRHTILSSDATFRYRWGESEGKSETLRLGSFKSRIIQNLYCI